MDPDDVINKIETVEIQGATAIAEAGITLLKKLDEQGAAPDRIEGVAQRLREARPTEPLLFNAIDIAQKNGYDTVLDHIDAAQDTIVEHAQPLVEDATVYTHCHSSTVVNVLDAAHDAGDIRVRVTETRPLYQGRTTAEELAAAGIPVTLSVDAAGRIAVKDADLMLIGADAVTTTGTVINKIGSELFAETAHRHDVPVYVVTDAWKFDPRSAFGFSEDLEQRVGNEVWPDAPPGVDIMNYAFERVAAEQVTGIVSEIGVHAPDAFADAVTAAYPELEPGKG